jgi:hypothetical protein
MGVVEVLDPVQAVRAGGWKVDASRGERNGRVSSEWFNRPDDERYLSLDDLWASVRAGPSAAAAGWCRRPTFGSRPRATAPNGCTSSCRKRMNPSRPRTGPSANLPASSARRPPTYGTRLARDKTQQDARLDMEGRAKKLLDRVG